MKDGELPEGLAPQIFSDRPPLPEAGGALEFEFEGLARTLAGLALNPKNQTPFTAVVRGGWGHGKTTLMRAVEQRLQQPPKRIAGQKMRRVKTIWFNAWKYPSEEKVLAGLLGALTDQMQKGNIDSQFKVLQEEYKHVAAKGLFGRVVDAFETAMKPESLAKVALGDGTQATASSGTGKKGKPTPMPVSSLLPAKQERAFHDEFRELFCRLSHIWLHTSTLGSVRDWGGREVEQLLTRKQERGIVAVFLDDLDRCRPQRVIDVIEAINLFFDLPGVCFFLGLDWERLLHALPDQLRDKDRQAFLEKIVQISLPLPPISQPDLVEYVKNTLSDTPIASYLASEGDDGGATAARKVAQAIPVDDRRPRKIKRFLNDLSLSLSILDNTGRLEGTDAAEARLQASASDLSRSGAAGDGHVTVPARAVLLWHLLPEVLPEAHWRGLQRRGALELKAAFNRWITEKRPDESDQGRESTSDATDRKPAIGDESRLLRDSNLIEDVEYLASLSQEQLHVLIHLASPPPDVAVEGGEAERELGRDLRRPHSKAWVEIAGGQFRMGSEKTDPGADSDEMPAHLVTVSPYRIGRYPVTNAEYAFFVEQTSHRSPRHWERGTVPEGKEDHPVVEVSWEDAQAFCRWLQKSFDRARSATEQCVVRLPTEAEWEFSARGSSRRTYPWGEAEPDEELATFNKTSTTPVGLKLKGATPEGVLDMAGNVWEWCEDSKRQYTAEEQTNPRGVGAGRVVRGGSFDLNSRDSCVPPAASLRDPESPLPMWVFECCGRRREGRKRLDPWRPRSARPAHRELTP